MDNKSVSDYRTVSKHGVAEIVEKKSRFIANVKPVTAEEDAVAFINTIKSKYWDARHNVYAYVIGKHNIQRYSDDGEPSGTAGIPTLEVIKKEGLQDVVVVVTRYFGGILLGAGGLVRAYGKSAKEGLTAAEIITRKLTAIIEIRAEYPLLGKIRNEILHRGHMIDDVIYQESVTIRTLAEIERADAFVKNMIDVTSGRVIIERKGEKYISI